MTETDYTCFTKCQLYRNFKEAGDEDDEIFKIFMEKLKQMDMSLYEFNNMLNHCDRFEKYARVVEFFMLDDAYEFYERMFTYYNVYMSLCEMQRSIKQIEHFGIFRSAFPVIMDAYDFFIDEIIKNERMLDYFIDFAKFYEFNPNCTYRRSIHWKGWMRMYEKLCDSYNRFKYTEPSNVAEVFRMMLKLRKYFEALCGGEMHVYKGAFLFGLTEVYKCYWHSFPSGEFPHLQLYVSLFVKKGLL